MPNDNRILIKVFILALVLRIAAIYATGPHQFKFGDALDYLDAARSLCEKGEYPERCHLPFFRAPLYPFFIAGFTFCHTNAVLLIKLWQALIDSFTVLLLFLTAKTLFPNTKTALIAAVMGAIYPPFLDNVIDIKSESLFLFLFLTSFLFFLYGYRRDEQRYFMLSGSSAALAALTRPSVLGLLPFLVLWFFLVSSVKRRAFKTIVIFSLFVLIPILPWTLRNLMRFEEFILISDESGYAFWRDNNDLSFQMLWAKDRSEYERLSHLLDHVETKKHQQRIEGQYQNMIDRKMAWYGMGIEYVRANPVQWIQTWFYKMIYFWRLWVNPNTYSGRAVLISLLIFPPLYVLGAIGLALNHKTNKREVTLFLLLFAATTLLHSFFLPGIRKRVCFVDPFMILFASFALSIFHEKTTKMQRHKASQSS